MLTALMTDICGKRVQTTEMVSVAGTRRTEPMSEAKFLLRPLRTAPQHEAQVRTWNIEFPQPHELMSQTDRDK